MADYDDKIKNAIKGLPKTALKAMLTSLLPIVIVVLLLATIGGFILKLFDDTSKTSAEASSSVHTNVAEQYASGDVSTTGIQISDEVIDEYIQSLEDQGLSLDGLYLKGYPESTNPTEEEIEQAKRKYIRQFMEADVASNHLYIGENGIKGCVYIKTEGSDADLTFIKYEDLEKMVEEKKADALKHYSINTDGELVLAISSTGSEVIHIEKDGQPVSADTNVTNDGMSLRTVNYKSLVEQYSFPFEFLVNLATTTQNPEFVYALAEDIKNSRIELTIFSGHNSTVTSQTEEWRETRIISEYTMENGTGLPNLAKPPSGLAPLSQTTEEYNMKKTTTTTIGDNAPFIAVTYADTWITNQKAEYLGDENSNEEDPVISEVDDVIMPETYTSHGIDAETGNASWTGIKTSKTNIKNTTKVATTSKEYNISENVVNENKVEEFIQKLDTPYFVPRDNVERSVGHIFVSSSDMLIELLNKNERTQAVVPIIKYILQEYTGDDYGVENFEYFEFLSMELSANAFIGDLGWEFTKAWINNDLRKYINGESLTYTDNIAKYVTEDKTSYICYGNSIKRGYGFDLIHFANGTHNYVDKYSEFDIDITNVEYDKVGSIISIDIVDEIQTAKYNNCKKTVTEKKTQYANSAPELTTNYLIILTDMYYRGDIKTDADWQNCFNAHSNGTITTYVSNHTSDAEHRNARLSVLNDEVYQIPGGILDPNKYSNGELLSVADRIWKIIWQRNPTYAGISSPSGSVPPKNLTTVDCSGYVSWVLYEYGYRNFTYQHGTEAWYKWNWNQKYGWTEIPVAAGENPIAKLQPGDLFVRYKPGGTHHILIVHHIEGNNLWIYDCGNQSNWSNSGGNPINKNWMLTNNAPGKIIRVTAPPIN